MPEAQLENFGSGLAPVTDGWFVVNVRAAEWWFSVWRDWRQAYAKVERSPRARPPYRDRLPWAQDRRDQ